MQNGTACLAFTNSLRPDINLDLYRIPDWDSLASSYRVPNALLQREKEAGLTATDENLVRAILIAQLGSIALPGLELDGHLLLVKQVGTLEDDAKRSFTDLLSDAVVHADDVARARRAGRHYDYGGEEGGCSRVSAACTRIGTGRVVVKRPQPSPEKGCATLRGYAALADRRRCEVRRMQCRAAGGEEDGGCSTAAARRMMADGVRRRVLWLG